jgi:hypothetical protein
MKKLASEWSIVGNLWHTCGVFIPIHIIVKWFLMWLVGWREREATR